MGPEGDETDEELARRAAHGSRSAFEELVERYGGAVLDAIERRVGDAHQALDLAQEAWVRVFRALARFRTGESFRAWLFAIALNAARDERRRRARSPLVYLDELEHAAAPRDPAAEGDERAAIETALARIPEPFRSALALVDRDGLSYAEAARALGCAVGTAKSRVHRGRLAFRDAWARTAGEVESGIATGGSP